MPVTTLDPKSALVVIDLQKSILAYAQRPASGGAPPTEGAEAVFRLAGQLTQAFRAKGLPVVLVNVAGVAPGRTEMPRRAGLVFPPEALEFVAELGQQPNDIVVTKRTWGVFASTNLEKQLRELGVTQVVLCGISTTAGVESSARQAYEAGFNVTLAIDAMMDMNEAAHALTVTTIFPRLGETGNTAEILALLGTAA